MTDPRVLCVTAKCPLPADNGGRQRLVQLLRAVRTIGDVDLVVAQPLTEGERTELASLLGGARVFAPSKPLGQHKFARLQWLTESRLPLAVAATDPAGFRAELAGFVDDSYDLLWCDSLMSFWLCGRLSRKQTAVVDNADVISALRERDLDAVRHGAHAWSTGALKQRVRFRTDAGRWRHFERYNGAKADLLTVCSDTDREALGVPGSVVIPNGYERAGSAVGRAEVARPPVLLFQGQMTYEPNVDAAGWFATEVFPLVRARMPDAKFVIVGRTSSEVAALDGPGVEVTGYVDDITTALARADAVVVPLRRGSGTRVKILEAFAHRIPVVSTTIGAEGLGVRGGRELLLADDAAALADACVRVLTDVTLRAALVDAAEAAWRASFEWDTIRQRFVEAVRRAMRERKPTDPRAAARSDRT